MRHGSLFAGIGGFGLGFEQAGIKTIWQIEKDHYAKGILKKHWPEVVRFSDITKVLSGSLFETTPEYCEIISGGDPCPVRSRARFGRKSRHPDLSGYFLALVGRLRPAWVVRENVPAPDVVEFLAALEMLGYGLTAIEFDSRDFTGQSRKRHFCIGCPPDLLPKFKRAVLDAADDFGSGQARGEESAPITACLAAHPNRLASECSYCFEPGRGLRLLSCEEREALQGFPRGWTAGLSRRRRCMLLGNAVTVPIAKWIGERIMETIRTVAKGGVIRERA